MSKTISAKDLRWMSLSCGGWATDGLLEKAQVSAMDLKEEIERQTGKPCYVNPFSAQEFYLFVETPEAPGQHSDSCRCPECLVKKEKRRQSPPIETGGLEKP